MSARVRIEETSLLIQKLEIKPGEMLLVRVVPPIHHIDGSSAWGAKETEKFLQRVTATMRGALSAAGLDARVPVVVFANEMTFQVLSPLEVMGLCEAAEAERDGE